MPVVMCTVTTQVHTCPRAQCSVLASCDHQIHCSNTNNISYLIAPPPAPHHTAPVEWDGLALARSHWRSAHGDADET